MSMDEMLLNELYGSEETRQDEEIKQAQVELVEAVAAEAGVDLNELDDDELAKFAHYVLSDEDEVAYSDETQQDKLAEADMIGRQMAHSYMDELAQLNGDTDMYDNSQIKIASAMNDVAEAWFMQKTAGEADKTEKAKEALKDRMKRYGRFVGKQTGVLQKGDEKLLGMRGARLAGTAGVAGGLGYGAYRLHKNRQEKKASVSDMLAYELEKIAEESSEAATDAKKDGPSFLRRGYNAAMGHGADGTGGGFKKLVGLQEILDAENKANSMLARSGRGLGALALAGGTGYGLYRGGKALMGRGESEKKASLFLDAGYEALALAELVEPEEFAKEAEFRAAEILLANGIDPTDFSQCEPENVKIASFPGVEYASDEYEAAALEEYNEMLDAAAMHIIDSL